MAVSAAPSWVSTTLSYIKTNRRARRHYVASASTADEQLGRCLVKMRFRLVEHTLKGLTADEHTLALYELVKVWDANLHDQMVNFLEEGGYDTEKALLAAVKPSPVAPLAIPTPVPEAELEKVEKQLHPASEHSPERELEEIVAAERLQKDPRLGAW
jgi:hypothetical protein